ncbi:hypothetical protein ACWE42_10165 [Sutcliffiella cohnii]|uniref:DUF2268 domain-containing protein n=1 Tax=Sutcliffiella cohnii TaxID=33932 RepID=A0A223KPN8_9BACI|nr:MULTISPECIES: hypothetical protein [Sutcliffiella]AST91298.1 hypothetical protein BC6307_08405 [Sutcliffiella cohnii]WBL17122.1 hypothetical protein O1A01_11015 [Sutcliffiella sp. NC1]
MDNITIVNLVPKFLDFYEKASVNGVGEQERWELWKEHYHFAAVPPGEKGLKVARELLNNAWEKYGEHISNIEKVKLDQEELQQFLSKVKTLLGYKNSIELTLVYFVGGFENNAFVAPTNSGGIALCLPVEGGPSLITLAHELTHVVHAKTSTFNGQWERTIAATILQEGLATHISKYIVPGHRNEDYIVMQEGWLHSCEGKREEIFSGIYPYLEDSSSETVYKFTMGNGTTNIEREAYFVGWEIVGRLLAEGKTFQEIASVKESDMAKYIRQVLLDYNYIDTSNN